MLALESKATWVSEGLHGKTSFEILSGIEKEEKVGGLQNI